MYIIEKVKAMAAKIDAEIKSKPVLFTLTINLGDSTKCVITKEGHLPLEENEEHPFQFFIDWLENEPESDSYSWVTVNEDDTQDTTYVFRKHIRSVRITEIIQTGYV